MKKFLSILLALAVGFTFTFGSAMSAFAATEYTLDDYNTALQAEKTAQQGYMTSAKAQAVNSYKYDADGFYNGYMKAAYEAAADAVIAEALSEVDEAINTALNGKFPTAAAPDKTVVSKITEQYTTKAGMSKALLAKTDVLAKTQAPLSKTFIEGKLTADTSKYSTAKKAYAFNAETGAVTAGTDLTAVQAVEAVLAFAKDMVVKADKADTDAAKIQGYDGAYKYFKAEIANIKTAEQEAIESGEETITVAGASKAFVSKALKVMYPVFDVVSGKYPLNAKAKAEGKYADFYKDATAKTKATLFGVEISDIEAVTKAEAIAVNAAAYKAITDAEAVLAGSGMSADDINKAEPAATVAKTMTVAEKYAEVKALGEKMKGTYNLGIKKYNDTNVDAAVKAAEALVYKDLGAKDAEDYITDAAKELGIDLEEVNFEIQKFEKAVDDAIAKIYKNVASKTPATSVKYGDNKTPEADYVYLQETYADTNAWKDVADDTVKALNDAESYDEINKIMTDAAAEFGKLMKAADAADVAKAQTAYINSLKAYAEGQWSLADQSKYTKTAPNTIGDVFDLAYDNGVELINKAVTVDGVKAAYEEAKALFANVKTDDELKAMKEDAEKKIAALPYDSKLTAADKDAVKAAYDAVLAYKKAGGKDTISTANVLKAKLDKITELEAAAINEAATELKKKLDAVSTGSDADIAARVALKADAEALVEKAAALDKEIEAVNDDANTTGITLEAADYNKDFDTIKDKVEDGDFYDDELENAAILLIKASKDGATKEEMQAALDAYNKLTEKQQFLIGEYVDGYLTIVKNIEAKLGVNDEDVKAYLNTLKVTVKSAKTSKKNVKVTAKVTVRATGEAADFTKFTDAGYTFKYKFYRSTKAGVNYTVKKAKDTTAWTNTAGKKGTKYYYKVKVFAYDKDGKFVGQTYQSQCNYTSKVFGK